MGKVVFANEISNNGYPFVINTDAGSIFILLISPTQVHVMNALNA